MEEKYQDAGNEKPFNQSRDHNKQNNKAGPKGHSFNSDSMAQLPGKHRSHGFRETAYSTSGSWCSRVGTPNACSCHHLGSLHRRGRTTIWPAVSRVADARATNEKVEQQEAEDNRQAMGKLDSQDGGSESRKVALWPLTWR